MARATRPITLDVEPLESDPEEGEREGECLRREG